MLTCQCWSCWCWQITLARKPVQRQVYICGIDAAASLHVNITAWPLLETTHHVAVLWGLAHYSGTMHCSVSEVIDLLPTRQY